MRAGWEAEAWRNANEEILAGLSFGDVMHSNPECELLVCMCGVGRSELGEMMRLMRMKKSFC
jgi:hypothetical protein